MPFAVPSGLIGFTQGSPKAGCRANPRIKSGNGHDEPEIQTSK